VSGDWCSDGPDAGRLVGLRSPLAELVRRALTVVATHQLHVRSARFGQSKRQVECSLLVEAPSVWHGDFGPALETYTLTSGVDEHGDVSVGAPENVADSAAQQPAPEWRPPPEHQHQVGLTFRRHALDGLSRRSGNGERHSRRTRAFDHLNERSKARVR